MQSPINPGSPLARPEPFDPFAAAGHATHPACLLGVGDGAGAYPEFSAMETERLERMLSAKRRAEMAASFALRRQLIAQITGCARADVVIKTMPEGAPVLVQPEGWALSLANKAAMTVVALSKTAPAIGVDVERVREIRWQHMLDMICADGEREAFARTYAGHADAPEAFFRLWTLKEAVLKATQRGFRAGAKAIAVPEALLASSGQGQIVAFGERHDVWTVQVAGTVVSLAAQRP